jgi:hypothetical protein
VWLFRCLLCQVVLGSSIDEALQWAQQAGNLDPPAAQLVKDALAQKDQPFSSECISRCSCKLQMSGLPPLACITWEAACILPCNLQGALSPGGDASIVLGILAVAEDMST